MSTARNSKNKSKLQVVKNNENIEEEQLIDSPLKQSQATDQEQQSVKLTALELEKLQNSQKTKQQIEAEMISLSWAENQLKARKEQLSNVINAYQQDEKLLSDEIFSKYGREISIDINTGIVMPKNQ